LFFEEALFNASNWKRFAEALDPRIKRKREGRRGRYHQLRAKRNTNPKQLARNN
jgi:hypothetical protein